jgi:ribosomal silencing factor RsfS
MADQHAEFVVTDARAPRKAVAENVKDLAKRVAQRAAENTPHLTGTMAGEWIVIDGEDVATSVVENEAPYARYVEYGTRYMAPRAPLGRAVASEAHR